MKPLPFRFPLTGVGDVVSGTDRTVVARCLSQSVLDADPLASAIRTVLWSGDLRAGDGEFDASLGEPPTPRNWGASAWASLDAAVQRWIDADRGPSLLIRTHASHIVSDAPSATRFARMWADHGVRLVYDLASMISPAMVRNPGISDLYERRVDAMRNPELARGIAWVLVSNVRVADGVLAPAQIDDGLIAPSLIQEAFALAAELGIAVATFETEPAGDLPVA